MKKICLLLFLLGTISIQAQNLPDYYKDYLKEKSSVISTRSKSAQDCFVFWTDTHLDANALHTPELINAVTPETKVVWGGDAIPAFVDDIAKYWKIQTGLESRIKADIYNLRGNHDFSCRHAKNSDKGETWSQQKTAELILGAITGKIHGNPNDPEACYYYFDAPSASIRYVVFDTNDSVKRTDRFWSTVEGVGDRQLDWIKSEAVAKAPEGWSFIFLMHVPIGFKDRPEHWKVMDFIEETAAAGRLRMVLCGHSHQDFSMFRNGVLWTCTASDAFYQDFKRNPFCKHDIKRRGGSIYEQAFDHVAVKADRIDMTRIGIGADRSFHNPVSLLTGKKLRLKASTGKGTTWRIVDTDGCHYVKEPNYKGHWEFPSTIASVSSKGELRALKAGEGLAVAMSADSSRVEFFPLNILADHARIPDKAAFFGNSLILGNYGHGLSAPSCRHDYYRHITDFAKRHNPGFTSTKHPISAFERHTDPATVDKVIDSLILSKLDGDEDLVSLQMGDNVNTPEAFELFKTSFPKMLNAVKAKCPHARVIWFGTWYRPEKEYESFLSAARKCGVEIMSIRDIRNAGTESHPGDIYWLSKKTEKTVKNLVSFTDTTPAGPRHFLTVRFKIKDKTYPASLICDSYHVEDNKLYYLADQRICDSEGVATHPNALGFKLIADRFIETFLVSKR